MQAYDNSVKSSTWQDAKKKLQIKMPNEVGGMATTAPEDVHQEMKRLLKRYNARKVIELEDLLDFH